MKLLGVDIGGTFTDIYLSDNEENEQIIHKVSTTPEDPAKGAITGIAELCDIAGIPPEAIDYLFHGTTIATNSVLEYDGVEAGMITTENYRDIIHIGRHERPKNYSIQQDIPWQKNPLVKRRYRLPVPERIEADGSVSVPLDENAVRSAASELHDEEVEAIAICFLHSYINDEHEQRAKDIVQEVYPDAFVTTSSEVHPQFREFERFTTTAMNAFIGPKVANYIERLKDELAGIGIDADVHIMQSNGGIGTEAMAKSKGVTLLYSGPAAGVLGGHSRGRLNRADRSDDVNWITLDMGGTSADIGIIAGDEIVEANVRETSIGGYPVMIPMLAIDTIGAGGGSIAYVDPGGAFRVGPKSAGAQPGPACYDRGGEEPTVTDAHVALGRIREGYFLGGEMSLATGKSMTAIEEHLADPLGMDPIEASLGVLEIVNSNMANAIRTNTIQKGRDPTKFGLVAFGGAGPLHAANIARELDIPKILVPASPGVLSAYGLSTTDLQYDYINTEFSLISEANHDDIQTAYEELLADAMNQLEADGIPEENRVIEMTADCRYEGQGYELNISVGTAGAVDPLDTIRDRFDEAHLGEFGHNFLENDVEIVNTRVTAYGEIPSSEVTSLPSADVPSEEYVLDTAEVHFTVDGHRTSETTPFFDRTDLKEDHTIAGPAIVAEKDSTIVIPPDFTGRVREYGDIVITKEGQ